MRKFLSMMLAIVMIVSMLPMSALATEEVVTDTEISAEVSEIPENYGTEVTIGSDIYYIENGELLYSSNNGRPQTINSEVTWVIEENGDVYYSKIDEYNTYIYKIGEETEIAKIFCPIDCFDVESEFVYYSYNGEVFKIDTADASEESVYFDSDLCNFYINRSSIITIINNQNKISENINLLDIPPEYGHTAQEFTDNPIVAEKLTELFNLLPYSSYPYFTTYGDSTCGNDDCNECRAHEVVKKHPNLKNLNFNLKNVGSSCYGFAQFAYKYIFGIDGGAIRTQNQSDVPEMITVGRLENYTTEQIKTLFASAKAGDFIQAYGSWGVHSMIFLGCNRDGKSIYVLQNNYFSKEINPKTGNKYGKNYVSISGINYTTFSNCYNKRLTIYRSPNYETLVSKIDKSSAGEYEPTDDVKTGKVKPSQKAKTEKKEPNWFSKTINVIVSFFKNLISLNSVDEISLMSNDKTITILGTVKNQNNEYWYLTDRNTYMYKEEFDKYFKKVSTSGAKSNILINATSYPTGNLAKGKTYVLEGKISSSVNIKTITGNIINTSTGKASGTITVSVNSSSYSIKNSKLDNGMKFNTLKCGTYYLQYVVTDITGNSKTWTSPNFSVVSSASNSSPVPTVSVNSIEQGQRAIITCSDSGALIRVWSTAGETSGYGTVTMDFTTPGSYILDAWTTKSGKQASSKVTNSIYVSQMPAPIISEAKYTDNGAMVTLSGSGDIYYTANGSTPTAWSNKYTGPIYLTDSKTIKAISASYGCANSNVSEKHISVTAPDAPYITLNTSDKIAQGKTTSISWNPSARAASYTAYLLKDGNVIKSVSTTGTTASFALDERSDTENFTYTIKVVASNFKGNSTDSNSVSVTAMHPVTVTVVDKIVRENGITDTTVEEIQQRVNEHNGNEDEVIEGNTISVQRIDYGSKPSKPSTPSKNGFTFAGYGEGLYVAATEDKVIEALYEINYYQITFYDTVNNKRAGSPLSSESYMYTESAVEPTDYYVTEGYKFTGWSVDSSLSSGYDYTYVDGNIVLDAVYSWSNEELPVFVRIDSLVRDDFSYTVNISLKNSPSRGTDGVQGRIVTGLYTAEGKNVYTQIRDLDSEFLNQTHNWDHTESITLDYTDNISYASVYVVAVSNGKTGGALSEVTTSSDITYKDGSQFWTPWSDWQTDAVTASDSVQVRTKTQYAYRDKQFTTTDYTKYLDGWNYWYTDEHTYGPYYNGATWLASENNEWRRREVYPYWVESGKNQWNFIRYYGWSTSGNCWRVAPYYTGICVNYEETGWIDYALPWESTDYFGGKGYNAYAPEGTPFDTRGGKTYYYGGIRWVDTSHYEYQYYDTYFTHHFWKWSDYSGWSDYYPGDPGNREIIQRTMYQYRTITDNAHDAQEESVFTYEKTGTLDNVTEDLAGELATVMIYKKTNTDPTEEQIEYIGQIEIGEGNTYSILANTKEVPHYQATGDFIVALAIEGGEKLINVDYIKAPVPEYTVVFYCNGELYKSVTVEEGESADVNEVGIPEMPEGERFVKWNKSVVNITSNLTVTAISEQEICNIVFVDHENETAEIVEYKYGDTIVIPENPVKDGKVFVGWGGLSDEGGNLVSGSAVITALWDTLSYTVKFYNFDGAVVSEQTIAYGEAAEIPEFVEKDGVVYSWDINNSEWWNVTCDMNIYPYVPQTTQVAAPTINVSTEEVGGTFYAELGTSEESGTIYYTLYEEVTIEDAKSYAEGIISEKEIGTTDSLETASLMNIETTENDSTNESVVDDTDDGYYSYSISDYIIEYTEPIEITEGTIVYAFTIDESGNISPISVFEYGYTEITDEGIIENTYEIDPDCPQITLPNLTVKPGETVSVPIEIKNNPGIKNLSIILGYDMNNLKLTEITNGDVFANDDFTEEIKEDGSCKFVWNADAEVTTDGTLLTLAFTAGETGGVYDISISVGDVDASGEDENPFATIDGEINNTGTNLNYGDVNGDGEVDFSDGILILKHDVGLSALGDDKLTIGDVNGDGEVDFSDAILVLKFDVGLISSFEK